MNDTKRESYWSYIKDARNIIFMIKIFQKTGNGKNRWKIVINIRPYLIIHF